MTATPARPPAASRHGRLTLDLVRDDAGFFALEPFWDTLVDQMAIRTPFVRWDWMRLWWEECGAGARLVLAVLRDAHGIPQAIAPLMLAREGDGARRHLVTLAFLGGFGSAHGERLDFIVPAGREDELTPRLCEAFALLRDECDLVRLNFLPQDSASTPHIFAALEGAFARVGVLNRHPSRVISLPSSWEEIEARHGANWRGNLRRSCRQFAGKHSGTTSQAGVSMPFDAAFTAFRHLHLENFPAGESTFATPVATRFHNRLAAEWLPAGRAILPMLASGGKMTAAAYGFIERGEFYLYQMGWDHSFARLSPGRMALRWSVVTAIGLGLDTYDMLAGDYAYKRQWSDSTRWLLDLEAHNPGSLRATLFNTLRAARRGFGKFIPEGRAA